MSSQKNNVPRAVRFVWAVEKVLARERQQYDQRKNIITYVNYRNILVITQPTPKSCIHVIDGIKPELSSNELDSIRRIEPYSEIERALVDETPHAPPEIVFGPEPDHGGCYYYQKADLARQRGEWDEVRRIGEQAFGQGWEPKDLIEWMPFLQSYVIHGDIDRLVELAPIITADPHVSQQTCTILNSMDGLSEPVIQKIPSLCCLE